MRVLAFAPGLLLGLPILFTPPMASAQGTGNACLEPLPAFSTRTAGLVSHGPAAQSSAAETPLPHQLLFVSPRGELCRSAEFLTALEPLPQVATDRAPEPGRAFLLSAVVPGAGQWYLDKGRWPAYVAVEIWAWMQLFDWRREGHKLQDQYKDLAWLVARRVSSGRRTEAGWDYYEALTKFQTSGAYDADPLRGGVQPEEDPGTFNGSVWALAREIYLPEDPEIPVGEGSEAYQAALEYYLSRAYAASLAWDWRGSTLQQEEYTELIRKADEALRSSTGMIGVILANHLLSAVDALVSGRLGIVDRSDPTLSIALAPGPFNTRNVALRVRLSPSFFSHVP